MSPERTGNAQNIVPRQISSMEENSKSSAIIDHKSLDSSFLRNEEDLIPLDLFPFNKFTVKKEKSTKRYLSTEQFQDFMDLEVSNKDKAQIIKDMFICTQHLK